MTREDEALELRRRIESLEIAIARLDRADTLPAPPPDHERGAELEELPTEAFIP